MGESVSDWLPALREGDARATHNIWQRYYRRLRGLARLHLGKHARAVSDDEDVAIQALHSFFRRAQNGSFAQLQNRDDLWRILACLTRRKAANERRHWLRGGGRLTEASPQWNSGGARQEGSEHAEPWYAEFDSPDALLALEETRQRMLAALPDHELRIIAEARLDGYTHVEIAARVQRSVPTVERRLRLIRQIWERFWLHNETGPL